GLIVQKHDPRDAHDTPMVEQTGPEAGVVLHPAVGDGQIVECHVRRSTADAEDSSLASPADGDVTSARAVDGQILGDAQRAGQGDGPVEAGREVDYVSAGVALGGLNGSPERAGAAVDEVEDREGARQTSAFQSLKTGDETPGRGEAITVAG